MNFRDEFNALQATGLDQANDILGENFTYKGAVYSGVISEVEFTADVLTGGQFNGLATVIVVPKTQLGTKPAVGDTVKVGSSYLRVERVKEDATSFELTLISAAT